LISFATVTVSNLECGGWVFFIERDGADALDQTLYVKLIGGCDVFVIFEIVTNFLDKKLKLFLSISGHKFTTAAI
jgi:hypothetical protein